MSDAFPAPVAPVPVSIESVDAAAEQVWNDAAFDGPVRGPQLRLWRYRGPAVVLGRSQQALGRLARAQARAQTPLSPQTSQNPRNLRSPRTHHRGPLPLIDRRAGGGAVLVGPWMLGMSLVVPPDHHWVAGRGIAASYVELGQAFTRALRSLGVVRATPASEAEARRAPAGLEWACFAGITAQEILVDGRKIVGLAQRRHRHGVLFVAGVLVEPVPWLLLAGAMLPWVRVEEGVVAVGTREDTREGTEGGTEGATEGTAGKAAGEAVEEGIRAARVAAAGLAAETISAVEAGAAAVTIEAVAMACRDAIVGALAMPIGGDRVA